MLTRDNYRDVLSQSAVSFCSMNIEPRPQSARVSSVGESLLNWVPLIPYHFALIDRRNL